MWAGISAILFWTVLIVVFLWLGLNTKTFTRQPLHDWTWLLLLSGGHLLLSLPFDWLGGVYLPNRYQQYRNIETGWWKRWARAAVVQAFFYLLFGLWLLTLGRYLGPVGTIGGMALVMLLLVGLQVWVARATVSWESFFDNHKGKLVIYLVNNDPGFTGGISGIPGMEVFIVPDMWRQSMSEKMLKVIQGRRHGALQTLAHAKGFLLAFVWTLLSFAVAVLLVPGGTGTGPGLVMTVALFSVISFAGSTILLSWISRMAVWEIDRWVFYRGGDADVIRQSFEFTTVKEEQLDLPRWQESLVAMPGPASRAEHMARQKNQKGAWNARHQSVFMAWAGLSLFSRALPAVLGKPERWVFLPGD